MLTIVLQMPFISFGQIQISSTHSDVVCWRRRQTQYIYREGQETVAQLKAVPTTYNEYTHNSNF